MRLFLWLAFFAAGAQEPYVPKPVADDPSVAIPFWNTNQGERANIVVSLVLAADPFTMAAVRMWASENPLLEEWQFATDIAVPLPERLLRMVKDGTPMPDFSGKSPPSASDWAFYDLYNRALVLASITPEENFKKSADDQRNVQFPHLFERADYYRGKVVPVHGRLLVLREYPAPRIAANQGVKVIYEAWIKGPTRHASPICVQCTELPPGLEPRESLDRDVVFYGYFLKKLEYQAANAKRLTLLLVGRTLEPETAAAPAEPEQPFSRLVVFMVAGGAMVLTVLVVGLSWWFRRGDVRVQSRIRNLREVHGLDFEETASPPLATPVLPPPDKEERKT